MGYRKDCSDSFKWKFIRINKSIGNTCVIL